MNSQVICSFARVFIDEKGFCRVVYKKHDNIQLNLPEAKELCDAILCVSEGVPRCLLHDGRDSKSNMSQEVREYLKEHPEMKKIRLASAFIVNSFITKIMANLYVRFTKPISPSKVFDDIESAEEWLNQMRNKLKVS